MPVKHRRSKRRADPVAEAQAWACMFACGYDFFGDASDWAGLREPVHSPPEARPEAARAWLDAVRDAWRRVGRIYMDHRMGDAFGGPGWALTELGEPEKCR